jgi:hypothetical protein
MNLLNSLANRGITKELSDFVTYWLAPLFILFNVIGWLGLTHREANRSNPRPSDKDTSDLGRAIWRGWLVGVLAALAGLWGISTICGSPKDLEPSCCMIVAAGILGLLLGVVRGFLPRCSDFRKMSAINRRRILSLLVFCAVSCSIVCGVLYYDSTGLQKLIVSVYTCMLIGYTATYVFEVGK